MCDDYPWCKTKTTNCNVELCNNIKSIENTLIAISMGNVAQISMHVYYACMAQSNAHIGGMTYLTFHFVWDATCLYHLGVYDHLV